MADEPAAAVLPKPKSESGGRSIAPRLGHGLSTPQIRPRKIFVAKTTSKIGTFRHGLSIVKSLMTTHAALVLSGSTALESGQSY
jgi:hypothetical protein